MQVIKKVTQLCNAFLWKGTDAGARGAKVSWETVCHPKHEGGLGIKELKAWNKACMMRNLWQILIRAGSLWVAWIRSYVLKDSCIWQAEPLARHSWAWKKLLKVRDLVKWMNGPIGPYKASLVWEDIRHKNDPVPWYKLVWGGLIVPRYSFISWVLMHDRLTTNDKMRAWGYNVPTMCSLCDTGIEDKEHLFATCPYTMQLWRYVFEACDVSFQYTTWHDLLAWMIDNTKKKSALSIILCLAWNSGVYMIWQERNGRAHGRQRRSVQTLYYLIRRVIRGRFAGKQIKVPISVDIVNRWNIQL